MKTINNIAVFDNDKCFLAMMNGYCYANYIALTEVDFNFEGIDEVEKLKPTLVIIPLDWLSASNKSFETAVLKRAVAGGQVKICALNKKSIDIIPAGLSEWIDVIINNPFDIGEIDEYLTKTLFLKSCLAEKRNNRERRSFTDRRSAEFNNNGGDKVNNNPGYKNEGGNSGFKDFKIDQRNKCVFLKGHRVYLTPKEFELIELLLTDVDRIFMADEIISHLWPESNRATKSDLYQYMHLLRKKIEKDPNHPQWIMTIKGFGYKLNISNSEEMYHDSSSFLKVANLCDPGMQMSSSACS